MLTLKIVIVIIIGKIMINPYTELKKIDIPKYKIGDVIRIGVKTLEANKERIQFMEGIIIAIKHKKSVTIETVFDDILTQRTFLIDCPKLVFFTKISSSRVRRSKLSFLKHLRGKARRFKKIFN